MAALVKLDHAGAGLNIDALEFLPKLQPKRKQECPPTARSCSKKRHDGCCVPELGKLTLAQQWNPQDPTPAFTMHGLWPGECATATSPPHGCPFSPQYDTLYYSVTMDPTLAPIMATYWPDTTALLWTHEWNRHGTCLSTVEKRCFGDDAPNDAIRYFNLALDVYFQYDVLDELQYGGIHPGNTYPKAQVVGALAGWAGSFGLYCRGAMLYEVRLALIGMAENQFDLRKASSLGDCPDSIHFPAKPTNEIAQDFVPPLIHDGL